MRFYPDRSNWRAYAVLLVITAIAGAYMASIVTLPIILWSCR